VPVASVTGPPQPHPDLPSDVPVSPSVRRYADERATPPWAEG